MWWDDAAQKYRSSFIGHLAYGRWTWPVWRWFMQRLPGDVADDLKMPLIRFVGTLDKMWRWVIVFPIAVVLLVILRLLLFIPGFRCGEPKKDA